MNPWFIGVLVAVVMATGLRLFHARRVAATAFEQRQRLADDLARRTGMQFEGDVYAGFLLSGEFCGVKLRFQNRTGAIMPGRASDTSLVSLAEFSASLPDQIVSSAALHDQIMGPAPSTQRTPMGNPAFDEAFSLYIGPPEAEMTPGFRTSTAADALKWAKPPVLNDLRQAGTDWFLVRQGRCELAMSPVDYSAAPRALTVAANVARAAAGQSLLAVPEFLETDRPVEKVIPLWVIAAVACGAGPLLAVVPVMLGPSEGPWAICVIGIGWSAVYVCWIVYSFARWFHQTAAPKLKSQQVAEKSPPGRSSKLPVSRQR